MIIAGIDIGTAAIKVVFLDNGTMVWAESRATAPRQRTVCEKLLIDGLISLSLDREDISGVATSGYGKNLFPNAEKKINEISANAIGAYVLSNKKARTIINIGGQDMKIIRIAPDGKVIDFKMNDKCAAGTGRFFEMAERILHIPIKEFGDLGVLSSSPVFLNNTCCVFAESELVSLLSLGMEEKDIIAGIHQSVARRITALAGTVSFEDEIYLDGGPAINKGLLKAVGEEVMADVHVLPRPQFTVAFGAAYSLFTEKYNK
ncbi:MAG: CoA activase [Spirochaetales bacterium]|nr:CoA activase [Spirochaetales bacterium]